ncbi:MAG: ABC transporter permease [Actinomycetes bacterium]
MTSISTDAGSTRRTRRSADFLENHHVYEAHRIGLPPMRPYFRELWRRRRFAYELSHTGLKADHFESPLGAIWLVLNPLLLAVVYYLLVSVISSSTRSQGSAYGFAYLAHILIGLFTWYYVQNSMGIGATSVTAGGRLVLNQAFPRMLLPISSVITSLLMYLPTLPVYVVIFFAGRALDPKSGLPPLGWPVLWTPVIILLLTGIGLGLAMIFATMMVYYRDTNKFLSYIIRIWLYLSPVLWTVDRLHGWHRILLYINPVGTTIGAMTDIWINGVQPNVTMMLSSLAWSVGLLVVGGLLFMSRERDFAVRL